VEAQPSRARGSDHLLKGSSRRHRLVAPSRPRGGGAVDLEGPSITLTLGERKLPLTRAEANELHDLLVERNLSLLALQSELARSLQADAPQPGVLADEEMRQELLVCLDAADAELQLAEGLRNLRQAARVPISPKPEY
jgi:hypothetical protein